MLGLNFVFLVLMFDLSSVFLVQMLVLNQVVFPAQMCCFDIFNSIDNFSIFFLCSSIFFELRSDVFDQISACLFFVLIILSSLLFVHLILGLIVSLVPRIEERIAMLFSLIFQFRLLIFLPASWIEQRIVHFMFLILIFLPLTVLPSFLLPQWISTIVALIFLNLLQVLFLVFWSYLFEF